MKKRMIHIGLFLLMVTAGAFAIDPFNKPDAFLKISPVAELGTSAVLHHTIQFGDQGTAFDYVNQGGQEILFFYQRLSIDLIMAKRHTFTLLYQPLTFETKTRIPADFTSGVTVDNTTFAPGTGLNLKYGFDFYRFSYLFSIIQSDRFMLGAGISLQLRNASIVFESTDGSSITVNQNLGLVPIIKLKMEYRFLSGAFLGLEADGFYASSSIFNGATFPFQGWIYDAALRAGLEVNPATDMFLSVRLLGGGATGTSEYTGRVWTESSQGYGYSDNNLTALVISFGTRLK